MTPFGIARFKGLLAAGSFTVLAGYVVRLSDAIVAGNMLGEDALAGVNLVSPVLAVFSFLGGLVATGAGTLYSIAMGRCERTRARQVFMQALWTMLVFGGLLAAASLFAREAFLGYMGASPAVTEAARAYMRWLWPLAVLDGLLGLFVALGYADGDARLCSAAYGVVFVANFAVSVVSVRLGFGTAGCALGSVVADVLGLVVIALHLLRKSNSFAPVAHFSPADTGRIVAASFGDAAAFLCDGMLFFFLNKFTIARFGSDLLPVVGVATALWGFLEFFNGVGVAVQPIATVYYGEGNTCALRRVMNAAMSVSLLEGVAFSAFFAVFPESVVRLVGVTGAETFAAATHAVRLMCYGFVALAFAGLFNSYYMFIERAILAGAVTFLCYLVMPVVCVAACSVRGPDGLWLGLGLGPFAGLAVSALFVVGAGDVRSFPLLLARDRDARLHVFDLMLTDVEIVTAARAVAGTLHEAGYPDTIALKASLMTEEAFMVVKERNPGRRVEAEATLDLNDGVTLTLRDNGTIFDITDADQRISSLGTYLVASMMRESEGKLNLATTGYNRNVFHFNSCQKKEDNP